MFIELKIVGLKMTGRGIFNVQQISFIEETANPEVVLLHIDQNEIYAEISYEELRDAISEAIAGGWEDAVYIH